MDKVSNTALHKRAIALKVSQLASDFVSLVKQAAKKDSTPEQFIAAAEDTLVKFASERNLLPSVVERLATVFNSAKAYTSIVKSASTQKGQTVALVDPKRILDAYKATGKKGVVKQAEQKVFPTVRPQATIYVETDGPGIGSEDVSEQIFQQHFSKHASEEEDPSIAVFRRADQMELGVARAELHRDACEIFSQMVKKASISGEVNLPQFVRDVNAHRPDLLETTTEFTHQLKKRGFTVKPEKSGRAPAILLSHNGLTELLLKAAAAKERLKNFDELVKLSSRGDPYTLDTTPQMDTDTRDGRHPKNKKSYGGDVVMPMFGFASTQELAAKQPAPAMSEAQRGSAMQHFDRLVNVLPAQDPSNALVEADTAARLKSTFIALLEDDVLADYDPMEIEEALNELRISAPQLATDPMVAKIAVRSMLQYDGLDPLTVKQFAEAEAERVRGHMRYNMGSKPKLEMKV